MTFSEKKFKKSARPIQDYAKPNRSDGSNSKPIERRLKQWHKGELDEIFNEGKALQMRLAKSKKKKVETEAQQFNKIMSTGKISSAIAKLTDTSKGLL